MRRSTCDLSRGIVVFTGDNGAGKTNLLEAISLLTPGRGLRRATYDEIAREGSAGGFAIHATARRAVRPVRDRHRNGRAATAGETRPARAHQRRNGTNRPTTCSNGCACVWLTPAMDALFTGPASDRRRFLDRLVLAIDPAPRPARAGL